MINWYKSMDKAITEQVKIDSQYKNGSNVGSGLCFHTDECEHKYDLSGHILRQGCC